MIRVETAIKIKVILAFAIVYSIYSSSQAFDCRLEFESQVQYDTGENATGVDVGDFNGDGYSDLIIANRNTDDIVVLVNDGVGNFSLHSTTFIGGTPRYVVAGDLDGDGDIDAATPNWDGETVSILLNDGAGNLLGALVDVFLMPFIPLLIPVMKVMAGLIKWLVKFMEDPMGALKEAWGNISNFVMNDLKEFGKSLFTVTFWKELWGDINWEQILKMGVGGAGLVGLVAALSGGISLAMAAPGFITRLVTGLIPGMGGGKGAAGNLLGGCCGPGAGGALTKGAKGAGAAGIGVRILSAVPIALAAGALAGVIIGGDGLPGPIKEIQEEFHKWLPQQSQHIQDAIKQQLYYTGLNLKEQTEYMKSTLDAQKTAKGDATYQEIAEHGSRTGPGWSQTPGGPNAWLDSVMNQNDMNVTIEIIPPAGTGIYTSGTEDGYSYKVDVVTARENQKWSLEG